MDLWEARIELLKLTARGGQDPMQAIAMAQMFEGYLNSPDSRPKKRTTPRAPADPGTDQRELRDT